MQEYCFNVHLLDLQVVRSRNCEESLVAYRLDDGGKGLKEILTLSLLEAPDHPSGLISYDGPISSTFALVDPLPIQDVNTRGWNHQYLYLVFHKRLVLITHRKLPLESFIGVVHGLLVGLRLGVVRTCSGHKA